MSRKELWVFLLLSLAGPHLLRADPPKTSNERLKEYETELAEQRKKLKLLLTEEKSLLSEVDRISQSVERMRSEMSGLDHTRSALERRIRVSRLEADALEQALTAREEDVRYRVRNLYMWGKPTYLKALASATSLNDLRRRQEYVRRWIEIDRTHIDLFRKNAYELKRVLTEYEGDRAKLSGTLSHLQKGRSLIEKEHRSRAQVLALVRDERDFYARSVKELEQAAKNLERLLDSLKSAKADRGSLMEAMKGRLILPVAGRVEKKFGPYNDPKINAKVHHKGIDIRAEVGASIRAVFNGTVAFADWFPGYGKIIILDHGGGYFTLYGHAQEVLKKVGEPVGVGETVARVGETGSLKGPYLYFELRYRGKSQDPSPWFAKDDLP